MKIILIAIVGLFAAQGLLAVGAFKVLNNEEAKIKITIKDRNNAVVFTGNIEPGAESQLIPADNIAYISFRNTKTNEQCRENFLGRVGNPMPLALGKYNQLIIQKKKFDRSTYNLTQNRMAVISGDFICELSR